MMDDLFRGQMPNGETPAMHFFLFPHLREFLSVDLRSGQPLVSLLNVDQALGRAFYHRVEVEFSHTLREGSPFPFEHLINLPLQLEEIIRAEAMVSILEHLGLDPEDEENLPVVAVFIVTGAVISMHSAELVQNFRGLIGESSSDTARDGWTREFTRLVSEEKTAVERLNLQGLAEAISGDSPDYFSLWESRN